MSIRRRAARRDQNEALIIEALRRAGCSVQQLSDTGVPDLLIWSPENGLMLIEVKTATGKRTEDQLKWDAEWGGDVYVVRSVEEALEVVGR